MAAHESIRMFSTEETQNLLRDKAKEASDEFTVKVHRRSHMGATPVLMATLSGAQVNHFTSPELWIPQLLGGGKFMLQGYHPTDLNKPVGGYVQFEVQSEPKDVDTSAVTRPNWTGPVKLEFPQVQAQRGQDPSPMYAIQSPSAPGSGASATDNNQSWARQAGGGSHVQREDYANGSSWANHQRSQAALEAERRELEKVKIELEREKARNDLEGLKKAHEADMKAMKAEITAQIVQSKPQGPDQTVLMMQEMMKQAAEDRREQQKQAAEDRRAAAALQAASDARFMAVMEKMSERPKEDPLAMVTKVVELLDKGGKSNSNEAQMKMMHTMSEMMSQQVGVAMDFVSAAADMQLGGGGKEESKLEKGIESLLKGVGAMAKGAMNRPPPQQYPPMQQPTVPPTYEQQALAQSPAPVPGQAPQPPPKKVHKSAIDQIEDAIRVKLPQAQVANALVQYFQDPSIQTALAEVGFDFEALIEKRLGAWRKESPANDEYLKALSAEVEKQIAAAGLFDSDEEEEEEPEAEGEEDPENDQE